MKTFWGSNIWLVTLVNTGNSLAVQWLGLGAFTAVAQVQSLVRELRSCKPPNAAKKKQKKYCIVYLKFAKCSQHIHTHIHT